MIRPLTSALFLTFALTTSYSAHAQVEGPVPTQVLVNVDAKSAPPASAVLTVAVNDQKEQLTAWQQVQPANAQVALLIDDGLRESVGRELDNLRNFVRTLSPGVEIMVGYMQYGHVVTAQSFTIDHERAAATLHLPDGMPGMSASPYICITDFIKNWPGFANSQHKARFILTITNGVDPYNGSTSPMNQGSPYVDNAIEEAQRAGVAIYSIYFADAGMIGGMADNSGQNYLSQITQATGGVNYWEGVGNPVSTAPFLRNFQAAINETYIATFLAPAGNNPSRDLVRIKFTAPKAKLLAPSKVRPGNTE